VMMFVGWRTGHCWNTDTHLSLLCHFLLALCNEGMMNHECMVMRRWLTYLILINSTGLVFSCARRILSYWMEFSLLPSLLLVIHSLRFEK
jgi:hypothetical protein